MKSLWKINEKSLKLNSRTNTTISVSVPPANPDFTAVAIDAHVTTIPQLLSDLGTSDVHGLTKNEAARRLETHGENLLEGKDGVSAIRVLIGQLGAYLVTIQRISPTHETPNSKRFDIGPHRGPGTQLWRWRFRRRRCNCSGYRPQYNVRITPNHNRLTISFNIPP
jgi:magnesium-transporting ATPase (P-type)